MLLNSEFPVKNLVVSIKLRIFAAERLIMKSICVENIMKGMPGITPIEGANLYENAIVLLHKSGHVSPTKFKVTHTISEDFSLEWNDVFNEQMNRTYQDEQSATERAAVCISALLTVQLTDYTIIERSRKGTGFDYFLGSKADKFFIPQARLEVSGIAKETEQNLLTTRYRQKVEQTNISDQSSMPAYISVVEFKTPKAIYGKKEITR